MQQTETEAQTTVPSDSSIDVLADLMVQRMSAAAQEMERTKYPVGGPSPDELGVIMIASICHEANRAYCLAALNDDSQPAWVDAPAWQRDSAIEGVRKHLTGYLDPQESHNSWMSHKLRDGWRYGEAKDPEAKTHPCLLPYAELPLEQQLKDHVFGAIVNALRLLAFPNERDQRKRLAGALGGYHRI